MSSRRTSAPAIVAAALRGGKHRPCISSICWLDAQFRVDSFQDLGRVDLDEVLDNQLDASIDALVEGIYWGIRELDPAIVPSGLGGWILQQILRLPDLDSLGSQDEWHLDEILGKVGRPKLPWLPGALARRQEMETTGKPPGARALSFHARLSRYVEPISSQDTAVPEIRSATVELLKFASDQGSIGHGLAES